MAAGGKWPCPVSGGQVRRARQLNFAKTSKSEMIQAEKKRKGSRRERMSGRGLSERMNRIEDFPDRTVSEWTVEEVSPPQLPEFYLLSAG